MVTQRMGMGLIYYVDIDVTIDMMLNVDIDIICEHQLSFQKIYMIFRIHGLVR